MESSKISGLNKRSLVTFTMLISLSILPISGIVIHLLGSLPLQDQARHAFMSIHNVSSVIFIISSFVHIGFNMKSIRNYAVIKINESLKFKREILIAIIFVIGIVALFTSHIFHSGERDFAPQRQQSNEQE